MKNMFFNFVHEVRQKMFVWFTVRLEPKSLRTTGLDTKCVVKHPTKNISQTPEDGVTLKVIN
jgi:hypothetical protein